MGEPLPAKTAPARVPAAPRALPAQARARARAPPHHAPNPFITPLTHHPAPPAPRPPPPAPRPRPRPRPSADVLRMTRAAHGAAVVESLGDELAKTRMRAYGASALGRKLLQGKGARDPGLLAQIAADAAHAAVLEAATT